MNRTLHQVSSTSLHSVAVKRNKLSVNEQKMINNQRMMNKNNSVGVNHNSQKKRNSFAVFKYLIVTTSIIFTFGGIGFGLAWRCGQDLQLSQSQVNNNSSNSVNSLSSH